MRAYTIAVTIVLLSLFQLPVLPQNGGNDSDRIAREKFDEIGMKFMGTPSSKAEELKVLGDMIIALEEFVIEFPESSRTAEAHKILSNLYYRVGRKKEALEECMKIQKLYPGTYEAFDAGLNIAFISTENFDMDSALKELQFLEDNYNGEFYEREILNSKLQLAGFCSELKKSARDDSQKKSIAMQAIRLYALAGDEEKGLEEIKKFVQEFSLSDSEAEKTEKEFRIRLKLRNGGKPYPIDVPSLTGGRLTLSQYEGSVVLLVFWAAEKKDSADEILKLNRVYEKLHPEGFEIIGISLDKDINVLKQFVKNNAVKWPQFADGKGTENAVAADYGITDYPSSYLIDKNGIIRSKNAAADELEKAVKKLLME